MGAIADFSFKKLSFFSSLLSVPCTKSYKPSSTAYLKELKRHVDDNFSVKCFISLQAMRKSHGPGADPGFFLGGGTLVSCSTSTPVNHIVFFCRIPVVPVRGGAHPLHPPPRSAPGHQSSLHPLVMSQVVQLKWCYSHSTGHY